MVAHETHIQALGRGGKSRLFDYLGCMVKMTGTRRSDSGGMPKSVVFNEPDPNERKKGFMFLSDGFEDPTST